MNYLDKNGVSYLWNKIKNRIIPISGGGTGATNGKQGLLNLGGIYIETLWTNPNRDVKIDEQNIMLKTNTCTMIMITHISGINNPSDAMNQTVIIPEVGAGGQICGTASALIFSRGYTWRSQNVLGIGTAQRVPIYGNSGARTTVNDRFIPLAVYGLTF